MPIKLIIAGLRRSGTTIFWESFRQDTRMLCYDEPFNQHLNVLPGRRGLKAPEEFIRLLERDPLGFWERFAPIHFTDELREGLSDRQAEYLRYLSSSGECVVLDVTRCLFKIRALRAAAPDAVLVYLYRPPASHASSHMLPSAAGNRGKIKKLLRRRGFWVRRGNYNGWSLESIIGESTSSLFAHRLTAIGLDPGVIYRLPAVAKLLAYWRVNHERVEKDGPKCFGDRFISLNFDRFCEEPAGAIGVVYNRLGMSMPEFDFTKIHPARGPHAPDSPLWKKLYELVGLPDY